MLHVRLLKNIRRRRFSAVDLFPGYIAYDSVTRPDSSTSPGSATEKGGAWTVLIGTAGVTGGKLYGVSADARLYLGVMPGGNGTIQSDASSDDWTNHTLGHLFRMTDKDNHLTVLQTSPINASLRYRAAGSLTAYAVWNPGLTNGVGATMKEKVNGAQLTAFVNGTQVANFTMAGAPLLQTGTKCGVSFNAGTTTSRTHDNYQVTP